MSRDILQNILIIIIVALFCGYYYAVGLYMFWRKIMFTKPGDYMIRNVFKK